MTPPRIIDLTCPSALVAMAPGDAGSSVVHALRGSGMHVDGTESRGRPLLAEAAAAAPDLLVVELSRLGQPGLVGLARLARSLPGTAVVLLLPGGLGGPRADTLGVAAVIEETDIPTLRALATASVDRSGRRSPQPGR